MKLSMDLVMKEIDTIDVYTPAGSFLFTLDELQNSSINNTEETIDVTGKNGRRISRKKRNKAVSISGTNGILSSGLLALQTGGELTEDGQAIVEWVDYLTVSSGAAATNYKAIGTAGAEITALFVKSPTSAVASQLTQDTEAAAGKFTYDPSTKALGFYTDVADGTDIIVYYKRKISATVLKNDSDKYSGQAMLYVTGLAEDKCANVYKVQFFFPKVDFSGEFSLDFGGDQTVHNFEATALAGACGAGSEYYTYTIFGINEADAATTQAAATTGTETGTQTQGEQTGNGGGGGGG